MTITHCIFNGVLQQNPMCLCSVTPWGHLALCNPQGLLAPGRCGCNMKLWIMTSISGTGILGITCPYSKVHGANMGPIWGRQVPGGPHVGPMKLAVWVWNSLQVNATRSHWWVVNNGSAGSHYLNQCWLRSPMPFNTHSKIKRSFGICYSLITKYKRVYSW